VFSSDTPSIPVGVTLCMHGATRELHLLNTLMQCLPFLDRKSLFDETQLKGNGPPSEFAYHYQLYCILMQMAGRMNWRVTSAARNESGGSKKRLDIFIANNGNRYGMELVVDVDEAGLRKRYTDQAIHYKSALQLSKVIVVNFISTFPTEQQPLWWWMADDQDVSVIHVFIPREEPACYIFHIQIVTTKFLFT
jgi:hypothetical protein